MQDNSTVTKKQDLANQIHAALFVLNTQETFGISRNSSPVIVPEGLLLCWYELVGSTSRTSASTLTLIITLMPLLIKHSVV